MIQTPPLSESFPASIAIAGAWGYIGRKFLDVAIRRGLNIFVLDPGPLPSDLDPACFQRLSDPSQFYAREVDLFHLALHPEQRRIELLLDREQPLLILNEKPMAAPEHPEQCAAVVAAVAASQAIVLYDFPELFDPLTTRILERLQAYRNLTLTEIHLERSKDREDPANRRNEKRMVTIQYQESVHCLAFLLFLMGRLRGSLSAAIGDGFQIAGTSEPYAPPNPADYSQVVDGRCDYHGTLGGVAFRGTTNFKRHAPWRKRRTIRGLGDGQPFEIEVSYLEGEKRLQFNGIDQPCDPRANSYEHVMAQAFAWSRHEDRSTLMTGLYPNPAFARVTYQLSSVLWRSCHDARERSFTSLDELLAFGGSPG